MKKIFIIFAVLLFPSILFPQFFNYPSLTFTSGHIDKNPSFASSSRTSLFLCNYEFLIFERHSGEYSNIGILKVDKDGVVGSEQFLTSGNFKNINPAIAYNINFYYSSNLKTALAVWQKFENGVWNLYGCSYFDSLGWGNMFSIDTASGVDKNNPIIVEKYDQVNNYYILYERNGDIIFKEINILNNTIITNENLTSSDTAHCQNPIAGSMDFQPGFALNYERRKPDNSYSVIKRIFNNSWSQPDTVSYTGNNKASFVFVFNFPSYIFESDRTGINKLYFQEGNSQHQMIYNFNNNAEQSSYVCYSYPIITENSNSSNVFSQLSAFLQRSDSIKIIFGQSWYHDSSTISDNSNITSLKINRGMPAGNYDARVWITYTKDSLEFTNIYAKPFLVILGNINSISNIIPNNYELSQNFPNPFNPETRIRFKIPENNFVKLDLFDMTGKLIRSLYNGYTSSGEYEYILNGNDLSSGTYFYKFTSGSYSQTKKLVLLK